ncbi:hypothetical protein [Flavobacterium oreochromis]|uniref:Uncharacterized protein n=1 Tax=Flavobacterium columnare TaxID=996 RepID=A0A246G769_9FLAO|nr:hypothetical protein [Flavobacterium oreochromis]OWP74172.1 hypothetical protein BWK62_14895 [Flavobacterium oreochromis]QYS85982.1 hypothetical protein JJC03_13200 [Flavobacterium oreochromis]
MISYNVNIPDNKQHFFLEFLELIGAKYEKKQEEDFTLTEEQKKILDARLNEPKTSFMPAREQLSQLREKYGL